MFAEFIREHFEYNLNVFTWHIINTYVRTRVHNVGGYYFTSFVKALRTPLSEQTFAKMKTNGNIVNI